MTHPLRIVDVFAEAPREGNQLAVVLDSGDLTTDQMQSIAAEMNFSETTFVTGLEMREGGYDVRIFTPANELPFAGHPTLGTAWTIRDERADGAEHIALNLGIGSVPVRFEIQPDGSAMPWLTAPPIHLGETFDHTAIAEQLGLEASDLDSRFPVQRIDAGIIVTTVPVRTLEALRRSRLQSGFGALVSQPFAAVHLFCPESYSSENDLAARFFFDAMGPREDPATGSATACLGAYLLEHDWYASRELSLRIEQGVEINRPSLIHLKARQCDGERVIEVGGSVIPTVRGELL
jgi:trans-2,3-dihydro-3-hydroxyanthranilate isomerase